MLLNNKSGVNMLINRATDYLFVLMPDDNAENLSMLKYVEKVEELCKQGRFIENSSLKLGKLICGDGQYLEKNTVVNRHELINVYSNLGKKYEIRFNEDTIDVVCSIDDAKF